MPNQIRVSTTVLLVVTATVALAHCQLSFQEFLPTVDASIPTDTGSDASGLPNESPLTLCTETLTGSTSYLRIANVTSNRVLVCMRRGSTGNYTPAVFYPSSNGEVPVNVTSLGTAEITVGSPVEFRIREAPSNVTMDCNSSTATTTVTTQAMDLTPGATYLLVVMPTDTGMTYQFAREAACVPAQQAIAQVFHSFSSQLLNVGTSISGQQNFLWRDISAQPRALDTLTDRGYELLPVNNSNALLLSAFGTQSARTTVRRPIITANRRYALIYIRDTQTSAGYKAVVCDTGPVQSTSFLSCDAIPLQ